MSKRNLSRVLTFMFALVITMSLQSCGFIISGTALLISLAMHLFFMLLFVAIFSPIPLAFLYFTEKRLDRREEESPEHKRGWRGVCRNIIFALLSLATLYVGIGLGLSIVDNIIHG